MILFDNDIVKLVVSVEFDLVVWYNQLMDNIEELKNFAREKGFPIIKDTGLNKLLEVVRSANPKRILEIGTAVGYSGSLMLFNSEAILDTLEKNVESAHLAEANFKDLGLCERVRVLIGDADKLIDTLRSQKYDLIFLDGPKGQYINYYDRLINMLGSGGVLVADNVLFRGYVRGGNEPRRYRSLVRHLREFNDAIMNDARVDTIIYDVGDGVSVSRKKEDRIC